MRIERVAAPVRQQVVNALRQAIVEMRVKPGERLTERDLIARTGVSRATVREALRELTTEGLVETIPGKGWAVAKPSLREAEELYQVRAALEGMATRQFVERASEAQVKEVEQAFDDLVAASLATSGSAALLQAKNRFYELLWEGAQNGTIRTIITGLQARVSVLRATSFSQPGRPAESVTEIRAIVEAIRDRDAERAERACIRHVQQAGAVALDALTSDPALAGDG